MRISVRTSMRYLLYSGVIVASVSMSMTRASVLPLNDYIQYWSAARLNLIGGNPYSEDDMMQTQSKLGWDEDFPIMMWNPPVTLGLVQVLGFLPFEVSRLSWLFASVILVILFGEMTWRVFGGEVQRRWVGWILVLTFGPVLQMLKLGQIVPFMMLGLVGFLYFVQMKDFLKAGLAASLMLVKPHTLYLFWMAFFFWSLRERRWSVWIGLGAGIAAPLAIAFIINPGIVRQYVHTFHTAPPEQWITATLGSQLRLIFGAERFWLQFAPSIAGCLLFSAYLYSRRNNWKWLEEAPIVVLASVATAAYGWVFDLPVSALALIALAAQTWHRPKRHATWVLVGMYGILSLLLVFLNRPQDFFWWAGSSLLILYLATVKSMGLKYPGIKDPVSPQAPPLEASRKQANRRTSQRGD